MQIPYYTLQRKETTLSPQIQSCAMRSTGQRAVFLLSRNIREYFSGGMKGWQKSEHLSWFDSPSSTWQLLVDARLPAHYGPIIMINTCDWVSLSVDDRGFNTSGSGLVEGKNCALNVQFCFSWFKATHTRERFLLFFFFLSVTWKYH